MALLALSNLPIEDFLPRQNPEDEIQNALARLGALHLRELDDVVPTLRFQRVEDAVVETLAAPRSARFVLALAPVIVWNIDHLSLHQVNERLSRIGLGRRLGWLIQVLEAGLSLAALPKPSEWWRRKNRAELVLAAFLAQPGAVQPPEDCPETPRDHLDFQLRSMKSLEIEWQNSDVLAKRWGIATELGATDFARALVEAASNG